MPITSTAKPTALYRLYDGNDVLMYVGIAHDLAERWNQHSKDKSWWPQVARKETTWYHTRVPAELSELWVIASEGPLFNRNLPPWRVNVRTEVMTQIREEFERLANEVFAALEDGCDLAQVAQASGWSARYIVALGARRDSRWFSEHVANVRDGKVKG